MTGSKRAATAASRPTNIAESGYRFGSASAKICDATSDGSSASRVCDGKPGWQHGSQALRHASSPAPNTPHVPELTNDSVKSGQL